MVAALIGGLLSLTAYIVLPAAHIPVCAAAQPGGQPLSLVLQTQSSRHSLSLQACWPPSSLASTSGWCRCPGQTSSSTWRSTRTRCEARLDAGMGDADTRSMYAQAAPRVHCARTLTPLLAVPASQPVVYLRHPVSITLETLPGPKAALFQQVSWRMMGVAGSQSLRTATQQQAPTLLQTMLTAACSLFPLCRQPGSAAPCIHGFTTSPGRLCHSASSLARSRAQASLPLRNGMEGGLTPTACPHSVSPSHGHTCLSLSSSSTAALHCSIALSNFARGILQGHVMLLTG